MINVFGYAAFDSKKPLSLFEFKRRLPKPHDVVIEIHYCGVCHSDIHQVRNEWQSSTYPMVPGHEIVGEVIEVGAEVKKHKVGDRVGVGCFVDSCRKCSNCKADLEQFCELGMSGTYNSTEQDKKTPTQGGYSTKIVVDENYVLSISKKIPFAEAAPLLCAGITTYSPLRHWNAGPGKKVAILGLGGLGHMGVKIAAAMGAEVTVLSHSPRKKEDALRLGAKHFINTSNEAEFASVAGQFDLILNTVSASIDLNPYLASLKRDGTLVLLGIPDQDPEIATFNLIFGRRSIAGSLIGGIKETQEMLDFCADNNISSDIELIPMKQINEAYERTIKGDVRYRFVIDLKTILN